MSIRNDYLLEMIGRFVEAVTQGEERLRNSDAPGSIATYEQVVGDVLDMDPSAVLALSPQSVVTMFQLSAVDESLAVYAVYSLEQAATAYDVSADPMAQLRREQARAIADIYGFDVSVVPPEVAERNEQ